MYLKVYHAKCVAVEQKKQINVLKNRFHEEKGT